MIYPKSRSLEAAGTLNGYSRSTKSVDSNHRKNQMKKCEEQTSSSSVSNVVEILLRSRTEKTSLDLMIGQL